MVSIAIVDDEASARRKLRECFVFLESQVRESFQIDEYTDAAQFFIRFDSQ